VDGSLNEISTLLPYVESKKFRVLAVSSQARSPVLPDVPTFREFGFDLDVGTWYAYVSAKGTPKDRLQKLQEAFRAAVQSNEFKSLYQKQGGVTEFKGPEALVAYFREQDRLWKFPVPHCPLGEKGRKPPIRHFGRVWPLAGGRHF
jgi:tripartite-type tricarboxylate transporter receptor subunit TctC